MSRVGVSSRLHNAVGSLATYICLCESFVAISFERCRYFLAHVACRNLPWQGLLQAPAVININVICEQFTNALDSVSKIICESYRCEGNYTGHD